MLPLVVFVLVSGPIVAIAIAVVRARLQQTPLTPRRLTVAGAWGGIAIFGLGSALLAMAPDGLHILPVGLAIGAVSGALLGRISAILLKASA